MITKSGTNDLRGSLYWYHNNSALSARNFFDTAVPKERANLPGVTVGGAIVKNRAFFFSQYEAFIIRGTSRQTFQGLTESEKPPDFGSLGRNTQVGDRFVNLNVSVSKDIRWTERLSAQIRGEVSNLTNTTSFNAVDNIMSSPTFGRYTSAFDSRRVQLALRLVF